MKFFAVIALSFAAMAAQAETTNADFSCVAALQNLPVAKVKMLASDNQKIRFFGVMGSTPVSEGTIKWIPAWIVTERKAFQVKLIVEADGHVVESNERYSIAIPDAQGQTIDTIAAHISVMKYSDYPRKYYGTLLFFDNMDANDRQLFGQQRAIKVNATSTVFRTGAESDFGDLFYYHVAMGVSLLDAASRIKSGNATTADDQAMARCLNLLPSYMAQKVRANLQ